MKFFSDRTKNKTRLWWAVCCADNKFFYGGAGINEIKKEHQKGGIGF
jgi:ribosomal-protein-alanine N-acetyltransferase